LTATWRSAPSYDEGLIRPQGGHVRRGTIEVAGGVLAAAVVSLVFYGYVLEIDRGGVVMWPPVVEGVLTGIAVVGVWLLARSRMATATGLVLAALIMVLGATEIVGPALPFVQGPLGWAVLIALVARLAVPHRSVAT
jgi:hypothetical protein